MDDISRVPKGLDDVSKYPMLFDALHSNYSTLWTVENLEKLAGRNLVRVFKEVEKVNAKSIFINHRLFHK